jgi:molybdate transport system regulatory protein
MLSGKVLAIKPGAVNSEIKLVLTSKHELVAVITNESIEHLGLKTGSEAFAIIKAPLVILAKGKSEFRFSTRNVFEGIVKEITVGAVNAEIGIELADGVILHSVITKSSVDGMELKVGDSATALFKASHVILAVRT